MSLVYLGLGSNIAPHDNIPQGLQALRQQFTVLQESPWYQSPARGFDGPDFINLVISIQFEGSLPALAAEIKTLEAACGRPKQAKKYASRTLDVDILLFDELCGTIHGIHLPRTDVCLCAYVLKPLLDIAPDLVHPTSQKPLKEYWPAVQHQPLYPLNSHSRQQTKTL